MSNLVWDATNSPPAPQHRAVVFTEHVNATYYLSFHFAMHSANWQYATMCQATSLKYSVDQIVGSVVEYIQPEVVFFTRWGQPNGVDLLLALKNRGIRCVYHIDDDLLNLPTSLGPGVLATHGTPEVVGTRRTMLRNADLIYASTAELETRMHHYFPDALIFSGMYAPVLQERTYIPRESLTIGYMGSKGHQEDLDIVTPALDRVLSERPDLRFETFGTIKMPAVLKKYEDRCSHKSVQLDYRCFIDTLSTLKWDLGLAPLADIPFNRCKAPTKFVEYTSSGIPTIASSMPVYDRHVSTDNGWVCNEESWHASISEALDDPVARLTRWQSAMAYIEANFSLENLNRQLDLIMQELS